MTNYELIKNWRVKFVWQHISFPLNVSCNLQYTVRFDCEFTKIQTMNVISHMFLMCWCLLLPSFWLKWGQFLLLIPFCEPVCCVWVGWDPVQGTVDNLMLLPVFSRLTPNAAVSCQSQTEALLKLIPVFKTIPEYMITSSVADTETECLQNKICIRREHHNLLKSSILFSNK